MPVGFRGDACRVKGNPLQPSKTSPDFFPKTSPDFFLPKTSPDFFKDLAGFIFRYLPNLYCFKKSGEFPGNSPENLSDNITGYFSQQIMLLH